MALSALGQRRGASAISGIRHHAVVGMMRTGSHAVPTESVTTFRLLSTPVVFATRSRSFTFANRFSTIRQSRLRVSRYLGYPQSLGVIESPHNRIASVSPSK